MKLVRKKKFIIIILNLKNEIFKISVIFFASSDLDIYSYCRTQLVFLLANKVFITVSLKYTKFINIFFLKFIAKLFEYTEIYNYSIDLIDSQ